MGVCAMSTVTFDHVTKRYGEVIAVNARTDPPETLSRREMRDRTLEVTPLTVCDAEMQMDVRVIGP